MDEKLEGTGHFCNGNCCDGEGSCPYCERAIEEQTIREISYYDGWRDAWDVRGKEIYEEIVKYAREALDRRGPEGSWAVLDIINHARDKLQEIEKLQTPQ